MEVDGSWILATCVGSTINALVEDGIVLAFPQLWRLKQTDVKSLGDPKFIEAFVEQGLMELRKLGVMQSVNGYTSPVKSVDFDLKEVLVAAGASSGLIKL
nr:katanin p80 WD40 repeat-containing subunit B1 homolog isoform X2 [Tanacetum cinerariifolium]